MCLLDDFLYEDENEEMEELRKYLRFEIETFKYTKWEINKERFKVYVICCEVMRKIAEKFNGTVIEDYKTQMKGENLLFNMNIKSAGCVIIVPDMSLFGEEMELFQKIISYSSTIDICPTNNEQVMISITIPDVYIDKGIQI